MVPGLESPATQLDTRIGTDPDSKGMTMLQVFKMLSLTSAFMFNLDSEPLSGDLNA